jgi:putative flippase GtrA
MIPFWSRGQVTSAATSHMMSFIFNRRKFFIHPILMYYASSGKLALSNMHVNTNLTPKISELSRKKHSPYVCFVIASYKKKIFLLFDLCHMNMKKLLMEMIPFWSRGQVTSAATSHMMSFIFNRRWVFYYKMAQRH